MNYKNLFTFFFCNSSARCIECDHFHNKKGCQEQIKNITGICSKCNHDYHTDKCKISVKRIKPKVVEEEYFVEEKIIDYMSVEKPYTITEQIPHTITKYRNERRYDHVPTYTQVPIYSFDNRGKSIIIGYKDKCEYVTVSKMIEVPYNETKYTEVQKTGVRMEQVPIGSHLENVRKIKTYHLSEEVTEDCGCVFCEKCKCSCKYQKVSHCTNSCCYMLKIILSFYCCIYMCCCLFIFIILLVDTIQNPTKTYNNFFPPS